MVLGNDFHGIEMREDGDVGVCLHGFYQAGLDFGTRIVLVVKDAELRMAAFLVKVELSVFFLVEVHSPLDEFFNLSRSFTYYFFHGCPVAYPVAGNHGILNVLFKVIYLQVGNGSDAALCIIGVRFFQSGFANQSHLTLVSHFQCITHTGNS